MDEGIALQEVILDENGRAIDNKFVDVNSSFAKVFGLTREEMIGKTMLQTNPNIDNIWIEKFGEVALSGKPYRFEYFVERLRKTLDVKVYSPKHKYFAILFSDITELKNKELELSEKYEELTC